MIRYLLIFTIFHFSLFSFCGKIEDNIYSKSDIYSKRVFLGVIEESFNICAIAKLKKINNNEDKIIANFDVIRKISLHEIALSFKFNIDQRSIKVFNLKEGFDYLIVADPENNYLVMAILLENLNSNCEQYRNLYICLHNRMSLDKDELYYLFEKEYNHKHVYNVFKEGKHRQIEYLYYQYKKRSEFLRNMIGNEAFIFIGEQFDQLKAEGVSLSTDIFPKRDSIIP